MQNTQPNSDPSCALMKWPWSLNALEFTLQVQKDSSVKSRTRYRFWAQLCSKYILDGGDENGVKLLAQTQEVTEGQDDNLSGVSIQPISYLLQHRLSTQEAITKLNIIYMKSLGPVCAHQMHCVRPTPVEPLYLPRSFLIKWKSQTFFSPCIAQPIWCAYPGLVM